MNGFIRKHGRNINFYISVVGSFALGYYTHWDVGTRVGFVGVLIAMAIVCFMAMSKIYMHHVIPGAHFWPKWMKSRFATRGE